MGIIRSAVTLVVAAVVVGGLLFVVQGGESTSAVDGSTRLELSGSVGGCRGETVNGSCVVAPGDALTLRFRVANVGRYAYGDSLEERRVRVIFEDGVPPGWTVARYYSDGGAWHDGGLVFGQGWTYYPHVVDPVLQPGEAYAPVVVLRVPDAGVRRETAPETVRMRLSYAGGGDSVRVPVRVLENRTAGNRRV